MSGPDDDSVPRAPTGRSPGNGACPSPGQGSAKLFAGARRRRLLVLLGAAVLVLVVAVAYGLSGQPAPGGRAAGRERAVADGGTRAASGHGTGGSSPRSSPTTTTAPPDTTTTAPPDTTTTGPGTLPQTNAFPSSTSLQFQVEMDDLWRGIVTGDAGPAMPSFFPEAAYLQLKTIPNPAADWQDRLVGDFTLDIGAAHRLLGADPSAATLVAVDVPSQYGHWVPPGVCYNSIGYFEVPNSRVVYQVDGATRSFGIASMISWRGEWYVVHLGAVLRTTTQGVVDAPATGPGTSAYSPTC